MATQELKTVEELFVDDNTAHQYIKTRAKQLIDFLQIDDEAFYKKLPHLQSNEPYKYVSKWVHFNCVFSIFKCP